METTALEPRIAAQIQGDLQGQLAVGEKVVQFGAIQGGIVLVNTQGEPPLRPRPRPVRQLPRPFPGLVGREKALQLLLDTLRSAGTAEVTGAPGIGKTALLQSFAYQAAGLPDGIIYQVARDRPVDDLLQILFDAFYTSDIPLKPLPGQLRGELNGIRALILWDDMGLARSEIEECLNVMPESAVLITTTERQLWGGGVRAVPLDGLEGSAALALVSQELGRELRGDEQAAARALVRVLGGHPLNILRAVARVPQEGLSLNQVAEEAGSGASTERRVLASLNGRERQVVAALGALRGAPLDQEHLETLGQAIGPVLQQLLARELAQAHSPQYSLTGGTDQRLPGDWVAPWQEWLLTHFTAWAQAHRRQPERILRDAPAIMEALRWGVQVGRWQQVLALIQAVEPALGLDKQWGRAGQLVDWALQAARATGDSGGEAWALHQQGTYALCRQDRAVAAASLQAALAIRERIGDELGAAITRHNLSHLGGAPAPPRGQDEPPTKPQPGRSPWPVIAGALAVVGLVIIGVLIVIAGLVDGGNGNGRRPITREVPGGGGQVGAPDLVVSDFGPIDSGEAVEEGFLVPIVLVVRNVGDARTGPFAATIYADGPNFGGPVPTIPESFLRFEQGLAAGEERGLEGQILIPEAGPGQTYMLVVAVDTENGEPGPGRVAESNENNNEFGEVFVEVPGQAQGDAPPRVQILTPEDGALFDWEAIDEERNQWFRPVEVGAEATDPEDGRLSGESLIWFTDREDLQDPFLGIGERLVVQLYGSEDRCRPEVHRLTVVAQDAAGNEVEQNVTITLQTICIE